MSENDTPPGGDAPPPQNHVPRNFYLGVVNGTLVQLGLSVMHPHLVLSAFVYEMTHSAVLAGLLATITPLGILWPQLYVSSLIEHRTRKKPFYLASIILRVAALLSIVAAVWLAGRAESRGWAMALFFAAFLACRSAQGIGNMPFFDIVGQTIHPTRLGPFFAYRSLFGGVLVLLSGWLIVQPILEAVESPNCYALLVLIAAVIMAAGWVVFAFAHEDENTNPPQRRGVRQTFMGGWRMLRDDANYRLLLILGMLVRINVLAVAFYVPYSVEKFGATKMAGIFLGVFTAGKLLSSFVWGRLSERVGNRLCLILVAVFFTISPVILLVSPLVPELFRLDASWLPMAITAPLVTYLFAIMVFGFALQGNAIAKTSYLLESAPPDRRASYRAFLSTALFPMTVLPLLAGLLLRRANGAVDVGRAEIMFAFIVVSGALSIMASVRLQEVREADREAA